ncbi:MAG: glycosyltransferase family 39 protein [Gallionella sp.]|nr:glycosyltransferase family 39 protein [Gallionella sp.]
MITAIRQMTPVQATLWLVALSSLIRMFAASAIGLSVDEAHYALYGLHLDWSYFDHPPMVGWLQAVMLQFGDSDLALRIPAILLFAATSLVLFRLCQVLFPQDSPWLGFSSVALLHSAVILQLVGLALIPESPLLFFGLLTVLALHGVLTQEGLKPWLWLGLCLGLAGLSKYTAITLVFTVILTFVLTKQWSRLKGAGPWLAALVATLVIMPVLYWNMQHDWASFAYQLNHGARNPDWQARRVVLSQLAQLLVFGPLIIGFAVIAMFAAWRERRHLGVVLCVATALPILLLFATGSGREMTLPHWTALAWVALIPMAIRWVMQHWERTWVRVVTGFSVAYAGLMLIAMFGAFFQPNLLPNGSGHPLADLYGWQQGAQQAERLRQEMKAIPGPEPVLFVRNWTHASRLAWYARPSTVQVLDDRQDQFDLWFGRPETGARGILVTWPDTGSPISVEHFESCVKAGSSSEIAHGTVMSTFTYYRCEGWHE